MKNANAPALLAALLPLLLPAAEPVLRTPAGAVAFCPLTGAITAATPAGAAATVWQSGEHSLWAARFADGSALDAAAFHATNATHAFSWRPGPGADALTLIYASPALRVQVTARARPDGVELSAEATPAAQTLLRLDLPARLRFDPASVRRFVFPHNGNTALGTAFNRAFFERQPEDTPAGWETRNAGPGAYRALYGAPLVQHDTRAPAVPLSVTADGARWLPRAAAARAAAAKTSVNRPPAVGQADLVLVDSPAGPYLSACRLGGSGHLWRLGGGVREDDAPLALALLSGLASTLAADPAAPRTRIGLVSLSNGPERGNWSHTAVADWRDALAAVAARTRGRVTFTELTTPQAMLDAARAPDFLCILNPYGEALPVPADDALPAATEAIRAYVTSGGNWIESGGHPFHQILRPVRHLSYSLSYPVAFADFMHLDSANGTAALYRVQPRAAREPWDAAADPSTAFVPGALAVGGDDRGGWCERAFDAYVRPGQTWRAPAVRLTLGTPVYADLARYAADNRLTRPLADKIAPDTLARLKRSVLLYLSGTCREKDAALDALPVPTLIHFADYLKGGFDKEYPDHLPPNPRFGTADEFRAFLARARALGHLTSPYTNPTWWCDEPKGPTFLREGDAPLLRGLDGKPRHERYSDATGWTITLWHPAVQAANRLTVRQFTRDFPVDILFQDQCGARAWHYDTNPASPSPLAYSEGMLAMNHEDSRLIPLGTENGWDRVADFQTLLSGLSWGIVPTDHRPEWVRLFKASYPPHTWEIFPLALALMHDKAIFTHHDLGQFVTNDRVLSWTLALGYSLSYRATPAALTQDRPREWLAWLDRLQKSLCARYLGAPLRDFRHDRAPLFATPGDPRRETDDGTLSATYGDVTLHCNLGDIPRATPPFPHTLTHPLTHTPTNSPLSPCPHTLTHPLTHTPTNSPLSPCQRPTADCPPPPPSLSLPPYGFRADAPGLAAGLAPDGTGYVAETRDGKTELWLYAPSQSTVSVPLPLTRPVRLTFHAPPGTPAPAPVRLPAADILRLTLPPRGSIPRTHPSADLAATAPRDRPGPKPSIAILDLGPGLAPALTALKPADWRAAFEASPLATRHGLTVTTLTSFDDLARALDAGPARPFAVINPYGELFPAPGPGRWRETLDALRAYVNTGGIWWETAAYSFHRAAYRDGAAWKTEPVGPSGLNHLRLPVGGGEVDAPPEPLTATPAGREWLGDTLADTLARRASAVNRGTPSTPDAPATILVSGVASGFIGGYRLDGWGTLWRVGGFNPDPETTLAVATAATLRHYTCPPDPLPPSGTRYLYHATLTPLTLWQRLRNLIGER